jgi:hypothetical protein
LALAVYAACAFGSVMASAEDRVNAEAANVDDADGSADNAQSADSAASVDDAASDEGGGSADFTASAIRTCRDWTIIASGSVAVYAEGSCRRRNGNWIWSTWSGSCSGDIANCDGHLRCGGC